MPKKLDNARELLMQHGKEFLLSNRDGELGKFNVRSLTSECGIALGTFYRYFDSKDDLVVQIMDEDWNRTIKSIERITSKDCSLHDKVEKIYKSLHEFDLNYRRSAMQYLSQTEENLAFQQKNERKMYELAANLLKVEIERGELELSANIDTAAYLLIQLLLVTGRNPDMSFDDLWDCMNFRDKSGDIDL